MDYNMQINYLKKDMLLYELNIRGIKADDSKTVEELRSTLRPVLQLEKKNKPLNMPPYNLKFEDEMNYIGTTLTSINSAITSIAGENAKSRFERFQSRLVHLLNRINRIPITTLSADESEERSAMLTNILGTLDQMNTTLQQDDHLSMLMESTRLKGADSDGSSEGSSEDSSEVSSNGDGHRTPKKKTTVVTNKFSKVDKWGLKFTGDAKSLSVHSFLERATELCIARRVSEKDLFGSAIDLFEGKALNWYRANRHRFTNWKSLSQLLCKHFEPPDYRSRLFKEILERTQDSSESIVEYLASMNALFRRYGGISEDVQLDIISRNLSPFYVTQLPLVNSLTELEDECLKLEAKKFRADTYVPPARKKKQQFVEPDFAFVAHDSNMPSTSINQIDAVYQQRNAKPGISCWNCKQEGHLNRDCPKPKKMHCYRCGMPDVTVRSCSKCNKNSGNDSRGSH